VRYRRIDGDALIVRRREKDGIKPRQFRIRTHPFLTGR